MPTWTTFDNETSSALRSKLPEQIITELPGRSAMEHALNRGETIVAVLPCRGLGQAALAVFRWNRLHVQVNDAPTPRASSRAGGFLGLRDEPLFEEEESQEKKSWWTRFWDG